MTRGSRTTTTRMREKSGLICRSPADERGGVWGTWGSPTLSERRGQAGEAWFSPPTRAARRAFSSGAESSATARILLDCRLQSLLAEVGPERLVEDELRVRRLPEQEV